MTKQFCLYAFLILFFASITLQFVRLKMRKRVVQMAEPYIRGTAIHHDWNKAGEGLRSVFADMKRMGIVKRSTGHFPDPVLIQLRTYRIFSAIELITTVSMLMVAAFGYKFCA